MQPVGDPSIRIIAGLGNPGPAYDGTRHNIGFDVLNHLARRHSADFRSERRWQCMAARISPEVHVIKPTTYMNLSGQATHKVCSFFKVTHAQCLVVFDDISLELGRLRIRKSGSAGGHNGMKSILQHAGDDIVPRIRIGIGAPAGVKPLTGHVLGKFSPAEIKLLPDILDRAADAIDTILKSGIDSAMNLYNPNPSV